MAGNNTKTPIEIEDLKRQWVKDPCWEIEDTEGFEAYKEELKKFSEEQTKKWKDERDMREAAEGKRFLSLKLLESIHIDGIKYTRMPTGWIATAYNSGHTDNGFETMTTAMCFIPNIPSQTIGLAGTEII